MSAHVFLILLNELGKRDKMRGLSSIFISFSQQVKLIQFYRSTNVRFYFSYDINIILKSYFGHENGRVLPYA